ncbi:hypothetical protein TcasGA2_TC014178 [Tribolium castaneum]|uniref:Uncharacterized protein n=1 Tax=Tribolium castaneum TaxID=7070 RepID=D6W6W1_TRICA|nr:hypothetical protein TcasGA2_TC014178 [Tribolium castaneum]
MTLTEKTTLRDEQRRPDLLVLSDFFYCYLHEEQVHHLTLEVSSNEIVKLFTRKINENIKKRSCGDDGTTE